MIRPKPHIHIAKRPDRPGPAWYVVGRLGTVTEHPQAYTLAWRWVELRNRKEGR